MDLKPIFTEQHIPCGISRHFQRYEYIVKRGLVLGKTVIDIGCGNTIGSCILASNAKSVLGIDPSFPTNIPKNPILDFSNNLDSATRVKFEKCGVEQIEGFWDVGVAVEVFEHIKDLPGFLDSISKICKHFFVTTPLAENTGKTRNKDHINEYSNRAFIDWLEKYFVIEEFLFQTADLRIQNFGTFTGDSFEDWHTVQMAWCRSKKHG